MSLQEIYCKKLRKISDNFYDEKVSKYNIRVMLLVYFYNMHVNILKSDIPKIVANDDLVKVGEVGSIWKQFLNKTVIDIL